MDLDDHDEAEPVDYAPEPPSDVDEPEAPPVAPDEIQSMGTEEDYLVRLDNYVKHLSDMRKREDLGVPVEDDDGGYFTDTDIPAVVHKQRTIKQEAQVMQADSKGTRFPAKLRTMPPLNSQIGAAEGPVNPFEHKAGATSTITQLIRDMPGADIWLANEILKYDDSPLRFIRETGVYYTGSPSDPRAYFTAMDLKKVMLTPPLMRDFNTCVYTHRLMIKEGKMVRFRVRVTGLAEVFVDLVHPMRKETDIDEDAEESELEGAELRTIPQEMPGRDFCDYRISVYCSRDDYDDSDEVLAPGHPITFTLTVDQFAERPVGGKMVSQWEGLHMRNQVQVGSRATTNEGSVGLKFIQAYAPGNPTVTLEIDPADPPRPTVPINRRI